MGMFASYEEEEILEIFITKKDVVIVWNWYLDVYAKKKKVIQKKYAI